MTDTTTAQQGSRRLSGARLAVVAAIVGGILGAILLVDRISAPAETENPSAFPEPVHSHQVSGASLPAQEPPPGLWLQSSGSSTGNPAWGRGIRAPYDTLWILETGVEIFSPPAVVGNRIYMAGNDRVLRALDRNTGDQLWSRTVTCGLSGGVAADSQLVYFCGQDGWVYAVDRSTGSEIWRSGLGYHVFTDAAVFCDSMVLAGNSMGSVAALRTSDGSVLWSTEMNGLVTGPAFSDSVAVFTTESGEAAAYDSYGNRIWRRSFTSQPSAPSISSGRVFVGFSSGKVLCFSLSTGETIWETALEGISGRTVVTRPAVYRDSLLVAGTCDRRVFCLDAATGEELWETGFENWVAVTPAALDTMVYASCDDGRIYTLSLNSGVPLDTIQTDSYSGTPPILIDGILYAGSASGDLLAIQGTVPPDSILSD